MPWRLGLIPLAALIAVLPLIRNGCSCGHDFDFHLVSWFESANQFSHGALYPHWAFTPAFNAGEPRFVFYPPLSWMLGALLGLLLTHLPGVSEAGGWNVAPIMFTWIALTASGLTFHRLARSFVSSNAAVLAAVVYLANPYMLFTAYERTAYGELLAAAWIPLLFHAMLQERIRISRVALPLALLWLTNAPAAVMGSYTLALLAAIRVISAVGSTEKRAALQLALGTLGGGTLGLCLAAFYVVPAALERRFVHIAMATITGMRIDQNFLFEHTGTTPDDLAHDQVLHTASWIAVGMLIATAIALTGAALRRKREPAAPGFPTLPLAILTAGIAFLLTPLSLPLWNHAPEAAFLQFTWRLLAILAPIFTLGVANALNRYPIRFLAAAASAIVVAVALTLPNYRAFQQPCDDEDATSARLALFHSTAGTDPTDEYTPATADNDALMQNAPPYWLAASATAPPPATKQRGPAPMHFNLTTPEAEELILNLRDYPAWQVSISGVFAAHPATRKDGLIAVAIPAGSSTVDVRYARLQDQVVGDAISAFALIVWIGTFWIEPRIPF
ncbi:MAG TPA: hypothetical protein VGN01_06010 [Acidobacteriaceae bacterium]